MNILKIKNGWACAVVLIVVLSAIPVVEGSYPDKDGIYSDGSVRVKQTHPFGTMYYISPGGSDSNSGTSESNPWLTFAYAIPKLTPGDTLILLDGVYEKNTTGYPDIQHSYGQPCAPITMKAQHPRKAILRSDGSAWAFHSKDVTWWIIDGLYADANGKPGQSPGYAFAIEYT